MSTDPGISLAHSPPFRLGRADVRPATREVIGPERREIVEPRVMQVLVALARASGEVLSRDDLIQTCWDGRIVSENAIDRVISRIRRLGESVAEGSFGVETITKVGYRLLQEDGTPVAPSGAAATLQRPERWRLDRRAVIGAGLALAVGGTAIWLGVRGTRPDVPPAASQFYERGVDSLRRGWAEDAANAVSAFRQAVTIAPDYADAWGMLAIAYQQSLQFVPPETAGAMRVRARSAARQALRLDPDNASALAAEALDVPIYGNWMAAEAAGRRVLALDRLQVETRRRLSRVLADVGRTRDALAMLEPIAEPSSQIPFHQFWLAWLLFCADRLEDSDRVIDRALTVWPRNFAVWFTRYWLFAYTGRVRQALALVEDTASRPIGIPERDFEIVELSARAMLSRSPADVEAAVRANMEAAPGGVGFCVNAIKVGAYLGRLDEAFAAADALYFGRGFRVAATFFTPQQGGYTPPERRSTEMLFSPACGRMRSDPRFRRLLRETGLEHYWRATGTVADVQGAARELQSERDVR